MSSPSTEFHKIWIEQCAATEDIRERFGVNNALDYLIGEKLFAFVTASEQDPDFAAELPAFVSAIRRLFTAGEIRKYLDHLERTKYLAPPEPDLEIDDLDDETEEEPGLENPVRQHICPQRPVNSTCRMGAIALRRPTVCARSDYGSRISRTTTCPIPFQQPSSDRRKSKPSCSQSDFDFGTCGDLGNDSGNFSATR